jgi:UDP-glucose 4-epimerase
MRTLVTGALGFIGTALIKKLLEEGHEVVGIDDLSIGSRESVVKGCQYYFYDVNEIDKAFADHHVDPKFDVCFHLAGLSRIQPSFKDPVETFHSNTKSCLAIAEWARSVGAKVIYSGSSSRWHDPFRSPYACFKHMGEEIFKMYKKVYGLNAEIVRFYNVYGPGEILYGEWAAVIGLWRGQIKQGRPITIVGDGEQRRDFTHIQDIIEAIYKISITPVRTEDAWELGTGKNWSLNQVAKAFKERFTDIEIKYIPDQKGNYRETLRENAEAVDRLDWWPQDRLMEYIKGLED